VTQIVELEWTEWVRLTPLARRQTDLEILSELPPPSPVDPPPLPTSYLFDDTVEAAAG
jgi:hypothetical protein